jgi:hypothetical protein
MILDALTVGKTAPRLTGRAGAPARAAGRGLSLNRDDLRVSRICDKSTHIRNGSIA